MTKEKENRPFILMGQLERLILKGHIREIKFGKYMQMCWVGWNQNIKVFKVRQKNLGSVDRRKSFMF